MRFFCETVEFRCLKLDNKEQESTWI